MRIVFNPFSMGTGNNMSFRKAIFKEIGYFDENFGMGTPYPTEDIDMFYRILKKGYEIFYNPYAIVYHKDKVKDTKKTAFMYGRGARAFLTKEIDITKILIIILLLIKLSFESIFKPAKREYLRGFLNINYHR